MRPLWSGNISFGLINIPINLYTASEDHALEFDMLRKGDLCKIRYKRICEVDGKEVPYEDIVKGYKREDDSYVVLEKDDFKKASPKKTQTIDIEQFVHEDEIDSKYFEKPYYLEPGKGADKAYVLLREALAQSNKVAVATYVFRTKEDLVILKPDGDVLLLIQLRFKHEIRSPKDLDIPSAAEVTRSEIKTAVQLVDQLTGKFNIAKFKDTYTDELRDIIDKKGKGKPVKVKTYKAAEATKPTDLMEQLRASLQQAHA